MLAEQEFAKSEKVNQTLEEFEKSNNPITEFFADLDKRDYLNESIKSVYQKYATFCLSNNLNAISAIEFQRQFKREYNLTIKTVEQSGRKVRVYSDE